MIQKIARNDHTFTLVLLLAFLLVSLIGILNHEMWRDELQAWMIARDSSSIFELFFKNLRYEGHPGLWHLILYFLSRFTHDPFVMQVLHLFIASTGILIFVKFSPFTKLQKILFTFSYFPLFEYCIISRNYAFGILLIFVFCALFPLRHLSYLPLSISLFFLANTNAYGLIIAMVLGMTLIVDSILEPKINKKLTTKWDVTISIILVGLGIIISLLQIIPPPDTAFGGWFIKLDLERLDLTLKRMWESYLPIPNIFQYHFWSTNIDSVHIFNNIGSLFASFASLSLFAFAVALFIRKPVVLFMYISGTVGILLFTYLKNLGQIRHYGHLFIVFVACLWVANNYQEFEWFKPFIDRKKIYKNIVMLTDMVKKHRYRLVTVILCIHLAAGAFAFSRNLSQPFSESKALANFILSQGLENTLIIGSEDSKVATLSGYLDQKIYYLESSRFGTFTIWTKQWLQRKKQLTYQDICEKIEEFIHQSHHQILLVLHLDTRRIKSEYRDDIIPFVSKYFHNHVSISKLKSFDKAVCPEEDYNLYMIKYKAS